ncbi:MAG: hypothetical protein JW861_04845 [Bacteroidales bacterium]|nr:hypothetical protein [Bacteroidales bacterium]
MSDPVTMRGFLAILLIFLTTQGFAQYKYEKEFRIHENEVPENAILFVGSMDFGTKIKWYKETGIEKISYEAKTNYNGRRHSIEFSEDGSFEDIEIEIRPDEIPSETFTRITEYLASAHGRYSIDKAQIQYSGDPALVKEFFRNRGTAHAIESRFEIVISTRVEGNYTMLELLFSENGDHVRSSKVIIRSTDNIEY